MKVTAKIVNSLNHHTVEVLTNDIFKEKLPISGNGGGLGSSVSGGELLFTALATCYCNDIYREAKKKNITVTKVEIEASGEFLAQGFPAENISYRVKLEGDATYKVLKALIKHTDQVAEIHNTLRKGVNVSLVT